MLGPQARCIFSAQSFVPPTIMFQRSIKNCNIQVLLIAPPLCPPGFRADTEGHALADPKYLDTRVGRRFYFMGFREDVRRRRPGLACFGLIRRCEIRKRGGSCTCRQAVVTRSRSRGLL